MQRQLGTCYYPEHWSPSIWQEDARRMADLGLTWVRMGEFSWSRLEPTPANMHWQWLDEAIGVLGSHGLKVILGTPTATPPRWMLSKYPDMIAFTESGKPRGFGSRRHYCFSHLGYRQEAARIAQLMAQRYGNNPHVQAWQIDNEYGCHDTTYSYSTHATQEFRRWLQDRYHTIQALNESWGNVFWSMEYSHFDDINLPNLTVTEANPSHVLDFRRFSSDQVVAFNQLQVDVIKAHSQAPVSHNYMGRVTDFDHYEVSKSLDFVTWDSYPLGFLEDRVGASTEQQKQYAHAGDCDFQAFHHDLYRGMGKAGRWWVMEQQPGPVNWAPYNPAPSQGMVRLWSWEAFAHGAEAVCYFRWRQAPFAQEQMHSGLLRPDSSAAACWPEVQQLSEELKNAANVSIVKAPVALLFDYDAEFAWAAQPHIANTNYFDLVFDTYKGLRKLGLNVDILPPNAPSLEQYDLVLAPGLMTLPEPIKQHLATLPTTVVLGPRTGAKTTSSQIPAHLPPTIEGLDLKVLHCESLRSDSPINVGSKNSDKATADSDQQGNLQFYREHVAGQMEVMLTSMDDVPVLLKKLTGVSSQGQLYYLTAWLDQTAMGRVLEQLCDATGVETQRLPEGVRKRETGAECFWFNYSSDTHKIGDLTLEPAGVIRHVCR